MRIVRGGVVDREVLDWILRSVRTPQEREGDLDAQMGACRVGEQRVLQLAAKYGMEKLAAWGEELLDYSERLVRAELKKMPAGEYDADDWLDDDGVTDEPRRIAVRLKVDPEAGTMDVDFAGSSAQVAGSGECGSSNYAFGVLLCAAMLARGRCAGDGRDSAAADAAHAGGIDCECAAAGGCGGRKRGDVAADCGCADAGAGEGCARAGSGGECGDDEQFDDWRSRFAHGRSVCVLRDGGGRNGRAAGDGRNQRRAHAYDEFAEYAG